MNKKHLCILAGLALLCFMQFGLRPWLQKKEADETLTTILHLFENGDFALVSEYWVTPLLVPPIAKLNRYTMTSSKTRFDQKPPRAVYTVILDFGQGTALPSGQTWEIVMAKTADGWQVESFELQNLP